MSLSSKSRKESTDSYASQQMQNGGVMPEMGQLQRFNQPADRPEVTTERIQSNDTDFSDDYAEEISDSVADENQPVVTETDSSITGYGQGTDSIGGGYTQPAGTHVDDADWNTTTEDDGQTEPERVYGNS